MYMFILLSMIFLGIVDDFYLQGFLAKIKQRMWWVKEYPDKLYRYDYICALLIHSFSWTFMIMLPLAVCMNFAVNSVFCLMFSANVILHATVDNLKANKLSINLIVDQCIHLAQIVVTAFMVLLSMIGGGVAV